MNKDRVLIIGAQQSLTRLLKLTLPDEGFDVICHERPGDVRADRNDEDVDIIVVDFEAQSPRPDPAPICGALAQNQNGEHIPIVAISDGILAGPAASSRSTQRFKHHSTCPTSPVSCGACSTDHDFGV